jgi:RNA polymerase sigma-70 factor (ECF subfamily)
MAALPEVEAKVRAACDGARWEEAVTTALTGYGQELMSYLVAMLRNASDADDAFGILAESLWKSLPAFRWESSLRTYAYALARSAASRILRDEGRRVRAEPLSSPSVEAVVAQMRSRTDTFLRTETKNKVDKLREALDPEDQTLLILRVNRKMAWREIAEVMSDGQPDRGALDRQAAALRKRFERLKEELRERLDDGES